MKNLRSLAKSLTNDGNEKDIVKRLYLVMKIVGGYEQLMNLPLPALNEIIECMDWETRENSKSVKK